MERDFTNIKNDNLSIKIVNYIRIQAILSKNECIISDKFLYNDTNNKNSNIMKNIDYFSVSDDIDIKTKEM